MSGVSVAELAGCRRRRSDVARMKRQRNPGMALRMKQSGGIRVSTSKLTLTLSLSRKPCGRGDESIVSQSMLKAATAAALGTS
jgi:hypothetical protein